jgi:hypothetical protein
MVVTVMMCKPCVRSFVDWFVSGEIVVEVHDLDAVPLKAKDDKKHEVSGILRFTFRPGDIRQPQPVDKINIGRD